MPLQIANPSVVEKVEQLARQTGLSKTAAVERAVDALLAQRSEARSAPQVSVRQRMDALLAQLDRLPELEEGTGGPLEWDEQGLPR